VASGQNINKQKSSGAASLLFWLVLVIIIGGVWLFLNDRTLLIDVIYGSYYSPTSELSELESKLELTSKGERILHASKPSILDAAAFNNACPNSLEDASTLGCYGDHEIYLYDIDNPELNGIKESVLAHELLHAAWERLNPWDQESLKPLLREAFENNKESLGEHMALYSSDSYYNELHSIIGTQLNTTEMPAKLAEHYAKYFQHTDSIAAYYKNYNSKFEELQKHAEELAAKINSMRSDIDDRIEAYNAAFLILNNDTVLFNSRANNGYYSSRDAFLRDRQALITRQNSLRAEYDDINAEINEANELIVEYNNAVIKTGELFDSINSNSMSTKEDKIAE
jgi:hypothetical protein